MADERRDAKEISEHRDAVRELSERGGPLATNGPNATVSNREWFRTVGGTARPTEARRELHDRLIAEQLAKSPEVAREKRAIVLAGPPGAGKSTLLRDEILKGRQNEWLAIDPDEFKKSLLRQAVADGSYERTIKPAEIAQREAAGEKFYPLELSALVHEESGQLARRMRTEALADEKNVIVDTVLSWGPAAQEIGRELEEAGYSVEIVDVEVPYELSEARIASRWQESYEKALDGEDDLGGRWVPSEYARSLFTDDGRSQPEAVSEALAADCPAVEHYRRYRTPREGADRTLEVDKVRLEHGGPLMDASTAKMRALTTDGLAAPGRTTPIVSTSRGITPVTGPSRVAGVTRATPTASALGRE